MDNLEKEHELLEILHSTTELLNEIQHINIPSVQGFLKDKALAIIARAEKELGIEP